MIVYLITNKVNGKQYVGQTIRSLKSRWRRHYYDDKRSKAANVPLKNAIRKYGKENFEKIVLKVCQSQQDMDFYEKKFIEEYKTLSPNGYNCTTGGETVIFSQETIEKMKISQIGRIHSESVRKKISESNKGIQDVSGENNPMYGRNHSEEAKKKMSEAKKGKKLSEEHKKKLSEARKGKSNPMSGEGKKRISKANRAKSNVTIEIIQSILKDKQETEIGIDKLKDKYKLGRGTIQRILNDDHWLQKETNS